MACKYKVKGIDGELNEAELKAYIANGGKAAYEEIRTPINISDKNRGAMDKAVNEIVSGERTATKVKEYIKKLPVSDETKQRLTDYLNNELKDRKKGIKEGLSETEKNFYDNYEMKFLNGEMTYENIMHQLGSIADRQPTPELEKKYNNIRNIFYAENNKRANRQSREADVKENKDFAEDINTNRLGLSDTEITAMQSDIRVLRDSNLNFADDTSFLENNDQLRAAFTFDQYAQDMDAMIGKFQQHYGEKYLSAMMDFVNEKNNQLDARVSVSVAVNNHLKYLQDRSSNPLEKIKLKSFEEQNAKISQSLGTRGSLLLNSLRAWNKDLISDLAWVGVVNPDMQIEADKIKQALGSEITDEDIAAEEDGTIDIFEQDESKTEQDTPRGKTAGYFKKKSAKVAAKYSRTKDKEQLNKDIEEQKKKCK